MSPAFFHASATRRGPTDQPLYPFGLPLGRPELNQHSSNMCHRLRLPFLNYPCNKQMPPLFVSFPHAPPHTLKSGHHTPRRCTRPPNFIYMKSRKPSRPRRASQSPGFVPRKNAQNSAPPSPASPAARTPVREELDGLFPPADNTAGTAPVEDSNIDDKDRQRAQPAISRDDRLREELAHPFRRPKLVIFGTLCLSAFVGTLFAAGRLALGADPLDVFAVNLGVNAPAVALFGFLAKREADFGRRALGVIAGCPEARDLPIDSRLRVGAIGDSDAVVFVLAGRARDLADVLVRSELDACSVVAVAVDAGELDPIHLGPRVWAPNLGDDADTNRAWVSWLNGVKRQRKEIAVFRIRGAGSAVGMGEEYLVVVGEPSKLDLSRIVHEI